MKHFLPSLLAALSILAVGLSSTARAESVQLPDPVPRDVYWSQIQGLMLGVAVTHCQQPLAARLEADIEWRDKHWISLAGCGLYGASFAAAMTRWRPGLWINIIGPAVGLTSVSAGWILSATDTIDANVRMDTYQIMGGILQVAALIRSIQLLRAGPPRPSSPGVTWHVGPHGVGLSGHW